MKYECPSCKLSWTDDIEPLSRLSHPLCIFCSSHHTQEELLSWQMDHLKDIEPKHFPLILRFFYRNVQDQLKTWDTKINDHEQFIKEFRGKDSPGTTEEK